MRPISLVATAFGPFAERQAIDFTTLGDRSFFLIEGPIGSGKTSVLDAICFALFGVSSGDERKGTDLRSHHARPDRLTEVTFDFELGTGEAARRYRVTRAPTQSRPAQRGEDRQITVQTSATIWELTPDGPRVATERGGVRDVDAKVEELIGVSADQFRQVIVLPQGKFREFLAADSGARKDVLEKLFGTQLYRLVEEALNEAARAASAVVSNADRALDVILAPREVATVDALVALRDARGDEATGRRAEATAATAKATAADAALAAGNDATRVLAERDEAASAVTTLEAELPVREADRARVDAGRKALPVVPVDAQAVDAGTRRDAAATALATSRHAAGIARVALDDATARLQAETARQTERDGAADRVRELEALGKAVDALAALRLTLATVAATATQAAADATSTEATATDGAKALADLVERIAALREAAARLPGATLQATDATRRLDARTALDADRTALADTTTRRDGAEVAATGAIAARTALEARAIALRDGAARVQGAALQLTAAADRLQFRRDLDADQVALRLTTLARDSDRTAHASAIDALEAARSRRDAARHDWAAGQAGRLATSLAEGDACPVCGSTDHPVRATLAPDAPSDADLEAAEKALDEAAIEERTDAETVAARQTEVDTLEKRVADLRRYLADDATVAIAALQARVTKARADRDATAKAATDLPGAEIGLTAATDAERQAIAALDALRGTVTELATKVVAAETTLGDDATAPLTDLQARKASADDALQVATQADTDLADATGRELDAHRTANETRIAADAAREATTQAQLALATASTRVDDAGATIPTDLATPDALAAARMAADAAVAELAVALEAATTRERAAHGASLTASAAVRAAEEVDTDRARELGQARANLETAVREAGFADTDAWRAACLPTAVLEELQARIAAFDAALAEARGRSTRASEAATGVEAPDLIALADTAVTAAAARDAANETAAVAEVDARSLEGEATRAEDADRALAVARTRHGRVQNLANLARAQVRGTANVPRISFQSYVLARVLDEVLEAATRRFLKVSLGRYEVRRRIDSTDRRAQSGLDIEIVDRNTNQARDTRTLSGGESFQASLSLAFGLSDVVQQHVGGVHLDCIFVDEGFGSLDPEALEHALAMLKELQVGGRLVGIISHVGDLRQHIDARLTLTRTPNGSTAAFHL